MTTWIVTARRAASARIRSSWCSAPSTRTTQVRRCCGPRAPASSNAAAITSAGAAPDRPGQPLGPGLRPGPGRAGAAPAAGRGDDVVRAAPGRLGVVDGDQGGHSLAVRFLPGRQPGPHLPDPGGGLRGGRPQSPGASAAAPGRHHALTRAPGPSGAEVPASRRGVPGLLSRPAGPEPERGAAVRRDPARRAGGRPGGCSAQPARSSGIRRPGERTGARRVLPGRGSRPEAAGRSLTSQRSLGDADALAAGSAWSALRRRAGQFDCVPCGGVAERGVAERGGRRQPPGPALVELTEFDRPRRLGSRTASSMMETSGALTFTAEDQGTVMSWAWQVHPKGLAADTRPALRPPRRPHGAQDLGRAEAPARRQHKPSPRLTDSAVPGALRYRLATAPSQGSKRPAEPPAGLTGEHLGGASAAARAPAP